MTPTLTIEDLEVKARRPSGEWFPIVHDVSLRVKAGEVVALIGESGAGKTTVGLAAMAYSRPGTRIVGGRVRLDDVNLLALTQEQRRKLRGSRISYVAQSASAALNPAIRLGAQVAEILAVHNLLDRSRWPERVLDLLRLLDLPDPREIVRRFPHQVSGGQQQRVMTAMAIACLPDFIVFDEPTTALDVTTQVEVLKAIKDVVQSHQRGAIYVSHDLAVVAQVADRILVMQDGRAVEEGETGKLLKAPHDPYTRDLVGAVRTLAGAEARPAPRPSFPSSDNPPLLELKGIQASYRRGSWHRPLRPEQYVLRGVDLDVRPGEVVALVGESGSGKSTVARVISGLLPPLSGEVRFNGSQLPPRVKGRALEQLRKIQMVCQSPDTTLNPRQRVAEAVGRPMELYHGLKGRAKLARVEELLELVELPAEYAHRYPPELSGGEKQRVSLARAFGAGPEIVLCDEVLSALDTLVASAVLELLKDLRRRLGVAYLFISHDLATVATLADRVFVLYAGQVCEAGPTEAVFSPPFHPYTALLMSSIPELRCGWLEQVLLERAALDGMHDAMVLDRGCAFRLRCPFRLEGLCDRKTPEVRRLSEKHTICCHREPNELVIPAPPQPGREDPIPAEPRG